MCGGAPLQASLAALAAAPSKDAIVALIDACFRHRHDVSQLDLDARAAEFGTDAKTMEGVVRCLVDTIEAVLFKSSDAFAAADVSAVLPADADARVKGFVATTIVSRLPVWREASIRQRVSLPPVVEVDWRVDVKSASSALMRMSVPSVMLNVKCRAEPSKADTFPGEQTVSIELSRGGDSRVVPLLLPCSCLAPPRCRRCRCLAPPCRVS